MQFKVIQHPGKFMVRERQPKQQILRRRNQCQIVPTHNPQQQQKSGNVFFANPKHQRDYIL
jgi:hypothetical protein